MSRYFGEVQPYNLIDIKLVKHICSFTTNAPLSQLALISKDWHALINEILRIRKLANLAGLKDPMTEKRLANALLQTFALSFPNLNLTRILVGYSPWAEIFKFSVNEENYIIRLINLEKKFSEREQEARIATYLGKQGISPWVYYASPAEGIIIMAYIPSLPKWTHLISSELIAKLASKIRSFHQAPILGARSNSVLSNGLPRIRYEKIREVLKRYDFYLQDYLVEALNSLNHRIAEQSFAHYDLNPNNILYDGTAFWIIDFESAGLGDPFLDLGTLLASARFNEQQEGEFLNAYFNHNWHWEQRNKLFFMKTIAYLRLSLSFFGNCRNYEPLLEKNLFSIPAFNDFLPKQDGLVDMLSDEGKFFISIMLAKQGLNCLSSAAYSLSTSIQAKNSFWGNQPMARFFTDTLNARIFAFLDSHSLMQAALVNKDWHSLAACLRANRKAGRNPLEIVEGSFDFPLREEQLKILKQDFVADPESPIALQTIKGGLSPWARIFLLRISNQNYILRTFGEEQRASAKREIFLMKTFSLKGVSPRVEHVDEKGQLIVMERVQNDSQWMREMTKPKLNKLAGLLRAMHTVRMPSSSKKLSSNEKFSLFLSKLENLLSKNPRFSFFQKIVFFYKKLDNLLSPFSDNTFCHYDLNPWNVLYDGEQFWAIDWEFAQLGHKYFDLATIINFLRLSDEQESFLLLCYFGSRISKEDMAYYYLTKQLSYLRYAICSLALCERFDFSIDPEQIKTLPAFNEFIPGKNPPFAIDKTADIGKFMIAIMFSHQALQTISSQKFQEALSLLNLDQKTWMVEDDAKPVQQPESYSKKLIKYGVFSAAAGLALWTGYKMLSEARMNKHP